MMLNISLCYDVKHQLTYMTVPQTCNLFVSASMKSAIQLSNNLS